LKSYSRTSQNEHFVKRAIPFLAVYVCQVTNRLILTI